MFVPSLSWQKINFQHETALKKGVFRTVTNRSPPARNASSLFGVLLSLCLSRACLGKTITFWYKMASRKICVSRTQRHDPVLVRVVVRHRSGRRVGVNQRAVAHKQRRPGIPAPGNIR